MVNPIPAFVAPSPHEVLILVLLILLLIAGKYMYNQIQSGRKTAQYESFKTRFMNDDSETTNDE